MKIGILTFHCAHNYGAVLQCYALQETLKSMGHEVEVIDYRPNFLTYSKFINFQNIKNTSISTTLRKLIRELAVLPKKNIRYFVFNRFINKRLNLSTHNKNYSYIPAEYDIYIIGSDQVWNKKITNGYHNPYFASFPFPKGNKKYISYAASMESEDISKDTNILKKLLSNFDAISVREESLRQSLQELSQKRISLVLDPTLIADKTMWHKLAIKPRIKKKYVLVYEVRTNPHTIKFANNIAKQLNAEVVRLFAWVDRFNNKNEYKCESPENFLGWFKHAECIVTTSFHGTAFSIIFEKPFYTKELDNEGNSRSFSLLNKLGLDARIINLKVIHNTDFTNINYDKIDYKLYELKQESIKYLKNNIRH